MKKTASLESQLLTSEGDDFIFGTPDEDQISALAGNDTVVSLAGNDTIDGGPGRDSIFALGGNDTVEGGLGDDLIYGGAGPVQDSNSGDDILSGDDGNDTIFGQDGNDIIDGGNGNDYIDSGNGTDTISGGAGNDKIFSLGDSDTVNGGSGADFISTDSGNDNLLGGTESDLLLAGGGNDLLSGESGDDQLYADTGNDLANGGSGNDIVFGGQGNDNLIGEAGNDNLSGGKGNDNLSGGNGRDRLTGVDPYTPRSDFNSGERDTLTGGGEGDTFILGTGTEVFYDDLGNSDYALIEGFNLNQDSIELVASPQSSPTVIENGDAGQSLSDAQVITSGSSSLDFINGVISSVNDVDLYQISLRSEEFSASTVNGADFDTQLFLFDQNGNLVKENDDLNIDIRQSTLSAGSLAAGTYFLGVSSFDSDPVGSPLNSFTNEGESSGDYRLSLNGVSVAPPENAGAFSLGASPSGQPSGAGIFFEEDLIGIVAGVSASSLSLDSGNFVFV